MAKQIIGILGGMGPMATVDLFSKIIENTNAGSDMEHIRILIDNNTKIPDRTAAILGIGESPIPEMVKSAKLLKNMGASFLLMPCNSAHAFIDEVSKRSETHIVNMVEETVLYCRQNCFDTVGILATTGALTAGIYKKACDDNEVKLITPSESEQNVVMDYIYNFKAGKPIEDKTRLLKIAENMINKNAKAIIMGCTEIPLVLKNEKFNETLVDPALVVAKKAIELAGYKVKTERA